MREDILEQIIEAAVSLGRLGVVCVTVMIVAYFVKEVLVSGCSVG